MTNKDIDEFKAKLRMKSYGNQTISDNSLLDIVEGIILYPVEGNLIAFDCNTYKEKRNIYIIFFNQNNQKNIIELYSILFNLL